MGYKQTWRALVDYSQFLTGPATDVDNRFQILYGVGGHQTGSDSLRPLGDPRREDTVTEDALIEQLLPKHIHAVTPPGFELKVALFVLACSINYLVR